MAERARPTWERHLTDRAKAGDEAARTLFVDAFRPLAFRVAMERLGNVDDAADVAQEAIVRALGHLDSFDAGRSPRPWIARIAANLCTDLVRARRRKGETELSEEWTDDRAEALVSRGLDGEGVRGAVARLPEPYQEAVRLRFYEELDVSEIATRLAVPEGTVKSWLFRARAILRTDAALVGA